MKVYVASTVFQTIQTRAQLFQGRNVDIPGQAQSIGRQVNVQHFPPRQRSFHGTEYALITSHTQQRNRVF